MESCDLQTGKVKELERNKLQDITLSHFLSYNDIGLTTQSLI